MSMSARPKADCVPLNASTEKPPGRGIYYMYLCVLFFFFLKMCIMYLDDLHFAIIIY